MCFTRNYNPVNAFTGLLFNNQIFDWELLPANIQIIRKVNIFFLKKICFIFAKAF